MIFKALAGVSAGVVLIGGGAFAAAQAEPGNPTAEPTREATTANTTSRTVASQPLRAPGDPYPASVFTGTTINLRRGVIQYGAANHARVVVSTGPAVDATPRGRARVFVDGRRRTERLRNGRANVRMPRWLKPGRYAAHARYLPNSGSQFKPSRSDERFFRVVKARSHMSVHARDVSRRERPRIRTQVSTTTGAPVRGRVRVVISNGRARHVKRDRLRRGEAVTRFHRVRKLRRWDVKVVYQGSKTVRRGVRTASFRNTRR